MPAKQTLLFCFLFTWYSVAQDARWVGKTIIVKSSDVKLMDAQGRKFQADDADYRVLEDKNGRLLVKNGHGGKCWLDKANVVLLDQAIAYFSDSIKKRPQDALAYHNRGWAYLLLGEIDR